MGLWPWGYSQMLSSKFIKLVRKDGLMKTWMRGHKSVRDTQETGGQMDAVKCVGQDIYGNKYYEDFDVDHPTRRRWVEYSNHFLNIGLRTDVIPPPWRGWMSGTYDDVPGNNNFVEHFYIKEYPGMKTGTPEHYFPPGSICPYNENRKDFVERNRAGKYVRWELHGNNADYTDVVFEGKKRIHQNFKPFVDPMSEY